MYSTVEDKKPGGIAVAAITIAPFWVLAVSGLTFSREGGAIIEPE